MSATIRKLPREDAALYLTGLGLCITPQELEDLAATQGGPIFYERRTNRVYPVAELDRWANAELGLAPPFDNMPPPQNTFDFAQKSVGRRQNQGKKRKSYRQRVGEEK